MGLALTQCVTQRSARLSQLWREYAR